MMMIQSDNIDDDDDDRIVKCIADVHIDRPSVGRSVGRSTDPPTLFFYSTI